MDKKDLEKDINYLKDELSRFVSNDKMYEICDKKQDDFSKLTTLKKEYKETKKTCRKHKTIKNLAIMSTISIITVPLVLVPSIVGIISTHNCEQEYMNDANIDSSKNYVCDYIYEDNLGSKIVLDSKEYKNDYIMIETEYNKRTDRGYSKNIYKYNTPIYNEKTLKEKVNMNYVELMHELGEPDFTDQTFTSKITIDTNKPKVFAIAKVYKEATDFDQDIISGKEIKKSFNDKSSVIGLEKSLYSCLAGMLPFSIGFIKFFSKLNNIRKENTRPWEERKRKRLKKEIKQLTKKIQ